MRASKQLSSQNSTNPLGATQQHTTNNREELKMKMLLTGSYDYIHRETGKMIKKKFYKKAFGLLEKFYQQRKDLEMAEVIQLNRRIISCVNKILKTHLTKPELEWESEMVLINIVTRGNQALFEIYKYLNIFIQKILPSEANFIMLEDVSNLSDLSEDQIHIGQQKVLTQTLKINEYQQSPSGSKLLTRSNKKQDHNESYGDRVAEMIQRSEKLLNIQFELEQLWYNSVELILRTAVIYKQSGKVKLTYFFLHEAERICASLVHSANPSLINLCARSKIMFANFLLETEQYDKALEQIDKALVILSGEFRLRVNSEKYITKFKINKEKRRQKKCAKTILSALMTNVVIYESTGQFHEMNEALQTASWFGEKFVLGVDELKKYVVKTALDGKQYLETFLHEVADLSYISEYALLKELSDLKKNTRDKRPSMQQEHMKQFNEEMYKLFQFKDLNEQQYYTIKNVVSQEVNTQPQQQNFFDRHKTTELMMTAKNEVTVTQTAKLSDKSQAQQHMGTDISINILDTSYLVKYMNRFGDGVGEFFDASFFAPSTNNFIFDSRMFDAKKVSRNQQRKKRAMVTTQQEEFKDIQINKNKLQKPNKSVGIIKIGGERPVDHRSDILTTNQYFKPMPKQLMLLDAKKSVDLPTVNFKKVLDNLEYRLHPEIMAHNKQDLDVYITKMVQDKIGPGGYHSIKDVEPYLLMQRKQEEFDKKEFGFGRKMLNLKKKEALMQHTNYQKMMPVKVEIDTKVKNEAYIIDSRYNVEQEVKELKKRKIDRMVADKKIKPQEVALQLKDPEETIYLKKALEKSKKKRLKDLILKYQQSLGLTKFFTNQMKEQRELEKYFKHKSKNDHQQEEEKERPKSAIKSSQQQHRKFKKNVRILEQQEDTQAKSPTRTPRTPRNRSPRGSNKKQRDFSGNSDAVFQSSPLSDTKNNKHDQIEKYQKKAHNVISLIIDEVEKKVDQQTRLLKKLVYQKKGGEKAMYVDEDEKTYLKFNDGHTELGRSTHLLKIKKELSEKQFTFEEIIMMRVQMKKSQTSGQLDSSALKNDL